MVKRKRGGASHTCPECGSPTSVLETRRKGEAHEVMRKRRCTECRYIFVTVEKQQPASDPPSSLVGCPLEDA